MSRYVFKMPDLGEGTVEAEIVACHIQPGDEVHEEQIILEVMTEKASVEIPAPVSGRVVSIAGKPGDSVPVGADLVVFDTAVPQASTAATTSRGETSTAQVPQAPAQATATSIVLSEPHVRIMASPATRRRAKEQGIDLSQVTGSGPGGRIERADFDRFVTSRAAPSKSTGSGKVAAIEDAIDEVPIIGLRRLIAQRMTEAAQTIPHFSYVEEVDVTQLESLRQSLNARRNSKPALTYLPFIALALTRVLPEFPQCNARYDAEREILLQHRALHLGVATQTSSGLKVPVLRDVAGRSLEAIAAEIHRLSESARNNSAKREELSGSTLTLTSLGKLGGIASTPIINAPEVCIIGVNKAVERPVVERGAIVIRRMMNLSISCDHRFVDGYDAASMVHSLKAFLEQPATIFIE